MKDLYALFRQSLAGPARCCVAATLLLRRSPTRWSSTASARWPRPGRPAVRWSPRRRATRPTRTTPSARRSSASWSTTPTCSSRGPRRPATATTCSSTYGSNLGPEEPDLIDAIKERKAEIAEREGVDASRRAAGRGDRVRLGPRPRHLGRRTPSCRCRGSPRPTGSARTQVRRPGRRAHLGPDLGDARRAARQRPACSTSPSARLRGGLSDTMGAVDEARRGRLTVYLGAAPGVGQDLRDARRGAAAAASAAPTWSSATSRRTAASQRPRPSSRGSRWCRARWSPTAAATFTEMDTDAVLARKPDGGLRRRARAHQRARQPAREAGPGRRGDPRAPASTSSPPSTSSTSSRSTTRSSGSPASASARPCPDEVVRTADQIQLVDMSPEALRRRMAHGNIYKAEQIDASLTSYFRVGNLTALRELALLWLADRVDDALDDYRRAHRIEEPWPAKERIVVAVTGGPESETLIRRGARLAQRAAGLRAARGARDRHRRPARNADERRLARAQQLVASLGGTFHSVVGEDVSAAVVDFAAGANATMIVVGVSRHGRLRRLFTGTTGDRIASLAGSIDVHLVTHDEVARRRAAATAALAALPRPPGRRLGRGGRAAGAADRGCCTASTTPTSCRWPCCPARRAPSLVALVGGLLPALLARGRRVPARSTGSSRRRSARSPSPSRRTSLALLVFVAVAAGGRDGRGPGLAPGRRRRCAPAPRRPPWARCPGRCSPARTPPRRSSSGSARRSARTPSRCSKQRPGGLGRAGRRPAAPCAVHPRRGRHPGPGRRRPRARALRRAAARERPAGARGVRGADRAGAGVPAAARARRAGRGPRARRGHLDGAAARGLARPADAAGHDARLRRRAARAAASRRGRPARAGRVRSSQSDRAARAADRQPARPVPAADRAAPPGAARPQPRRGAAARGRPATRRTPSRSRSRSPRRWCSPTPACSSGWSPTWSATPSASRAGHAGAGAGARAAGHGRGAWWSTAGPASRPTQRERMFEPFQRLDDTSAGGLGLGLAVARGLTEAVGGTLSAEDTPGGGLTMVLVAPRGTATAARAAAS